MSRGFNRADVVFTQEVSSLAAGAEIDTGFIDYGTADKLQITFQGDTAGLTYVQESKMQSSSSNVRTLTVPQTLASDTVSIPARFAFNRIRLQNNTGAAIANVGLQIKKTFGSSDKASVRSLTAQPVEQAQAMLTQSVITGEDPNGVFVNTGVNQAGALLTSDFGTEVARDLYSGYHIETKFGRNPDIDQNSAPEDMWNGGAEYTGFNATQNENLEVFSSDNDDRGSLLTSGTATDGSATTLVDSGAKFIDDGVSVGDIVINDTKGLHGYVESLTETQIDVLQWYNGANISQNSEAGDDYRIATSIDTGAAVVRWENPLNANYEEGAPFYVIMNGTSSVNVLGDFFRLTRGRVVLAGSSGLNEGVITARQATTTANVFAVMPTFGQTTIGAFTVPKDKVCIIKRFATGITRVNGSPGSATIILNTRDGKYGAWNSKRVYEVSTATRVDEDMEGGLVFAPETDIKTTIYDVSDNNTIADSEVEYYLIDR